MSLLIATGVVVHWLAITLPTFVSNVEARRIGGLKKMPRYLKPRQNCWRRARRLSQASLMMMVAHGATGQASWATTTFARFRQYKPQSPAQSQHNDQTTQGVSGVLDIIRRAISLQRL
jgi:hypothetical protein